VRIRIAKQSKKAGWRMMRNITPVHLKKFHFELLIF
jgi:hypothetical protein